MPTKIGKGNKGWQKSNKKPKEEMHDKKCIIGVDQSYSRTGVSIAIDGKLVKVKSISLRKIKTKTMKRRSATNYVEKALKICLKKYEPEDIAIICERIRTFTAGMDLRPNVIKPFAAMTCCFVDMAYDYGVEVWSVDTRAWKNAILGTTKLIFEPIEGVSNIQKFGSVRRVIDLGFYDSLVREGRHGTHYTLDDDAADSACIALYGFTKDRKLQREY